MKLFRTRVGIDFSGSRVALVAVRASLGGASVVAPPLVREFRSDREAARLEEAETILGEFVAQHGLVGADACLVLPAARVHLARAVFPPLRDNDLKEAVGLELERLFPVPPASLRYGYRRLPASFPGGRGVVVVAAVSAAYLERCAQIVSRAGMTLTAAAPAGWAAAAARVRLPGGGDANPDACDVLLRWLGDSVECTARAGHEAIFSSCRPCTLESAPAEGIAMARAALADLSPATGETVDLLAAPEWFPEKEVRTGDGEATFRLREDFAIPASQVLAGPAPPADAADPFPVLCAYGAAAAGSEIDLVAPKGAGEMSRAGRALVAISAAAALLLGAAWPAAVAWRAKADLRRLDAQVASLQPYAEKYRESLAGLDEGQARIAVLQEEASATGEALAIFKELTDRIPNGSWLVSLRVEGRKVDLEGISPSASEIFPALTRDGRFRSVDFAAPITRYGENMERFKIRGEYVPPPATAGPPQAAAASGGKR